MRFLVFIAILLTLAIVLGGCATPRLEPSVEVPGRFAQAAAPQDEPEVAWWESYGDRVQSDA